MMPQPISIARRGYGLLSTCLIAFALLAGASAGALAADNASSTDKPAVADLPKALQQSVKSGQIEVVRAFKTDVPGLTGYVLSQSGQHQIVYSENGYLIMGRIVSPDGENLSAAYTDKYVPKPDLAKIAQQLEATGHLVQQGPDKAPKIYVFADPNCIYCHKFSDQAAPLVKNDKLQLQWAMVGFLKDTSAGRAAAILTADDPAKAFARNEAGFDEASESGGIEPVQDIDADIQNVLDAHAKQMAAAGGSGTPTLVYKDAQGKWQSKVGAPGRDWLNSFIAGAKE